MEEIKIPKINKRRVTTLYIVAIISLLIAFFVFYLFFVDNVIMQNVEAVANFFGAINPNNGAFPISGEMQLLTEICGRNILTLLGFGGLVGVEGAVNNIFTVNFNGDDIESSTTINITATKIQYSQTVFLGHHKAFYISKSGTKILDYYALKAVYVNEKVYPDDTVTSFEFVHVKPSTLTREVTRIPYTKILGITGMSTNNNTIESIYDVDGAGTFEITVVSDENLKEGSSSSSVSGTAYCIFVIRANVIKKTIEVVQQPFWIRYYYQPAYNSILCFNDTVIDVFTRDTSSPYEIEFLSNENVTYEIIPYLEEAYYYGGYFNSPNAIVQEDTKYPNPVPIVLI